MTTEQLIKIMDQYESAVMTYVLAFCAKHEIDFDGWIGNRIGEIALFNDYFMNFSDLKYDIDSQQPKERIWKWYDISLEHAYNDEKTMNFEVYCKTEQVK